MHTTHNEVVESIAATSIGLVWPHWDGFGCAILQQTQPSCAAVFQISPILSKLSRSGCGNFCQLVYRNQREASHCHKVGTCHRSPRHPVLRIAFRDNGAALVTFPGRLVEQDMDPPRHPTGLERTLSVTRRQDLSGHADWKGAEKEVDSLNLSSIKGFSSLGSKKCALSALVLEPYFVILRLLLGS